MTASRISNYIHRAWDSTPRQWIQSVQRNFGNREVLRAFDTSHPAIFVLSTGRVGTQTLSALLKLAPTIFAHHEPSPELYALSKLAYTYDGNTDALKILKASFLTARKDAFNYAFSCGRGYAETSPQSTFLAPAILTALPDTKFIHLVRNPADVVRSGMRRNWYNGHPSDNNRIVPHPNSPEAKVWQTYSPFQKNSWLWHETNRWIAEFSASLPASQQLRLHSEDIFNNHEESVRQLFSFVGVETPPHLKIESLLGKKLNAQETGVFPKPSEWSDKMYDDLLAIVGKTAAKVGYQLSKRS